MTSADTVHYQPDRLDDYDCALVAAMAGGKSATEAAAAVGLSVTTVYRRQRRPLFRAALTEARAGLFRPAASAAVESLPAAVARLRAILTADDKKPADHIQAARALADLALKFSEQVDIRAELADVQAQLAELPGNERGDPYAATDEPADPPTAVTDATAPEGATTDDR